MTSHVPHLDLVILNFKAQTLEIFNNEGPLTISKKLFTVSVSRWDTSVRKGGTVSKTYIFYELSLIWLNNSAIAPMKASSFSMLLIVVSFYTLSKQDFPSALCNLYICLWQTRFFRQVSFLRFLPLVFFIRCLKATLWSFHQIQRETQLIL